MPLMSGTPELPEVPARRFTDAAPGNVTVIPAGLSVEGELSCGESLEVAGRIRGPVDVGGLCHLHSNAWVVGEITTGDAVIEGEVEGPLTARGQVELRPSARVRGDIEADSVALADGCYFEGHIHMVGGPGSSPRPSTRNAHPAPADPEGLVAAEGGTMRRPARALIVLLALVGSARAEGPGDWSVLAAREEIAPRSWTEPDAGGGMRLGLAGRGDAAVDGRWVREVPVTAGASYSFRAEYRARGVETPRRSVLARIVWIDETHLHRRAMEYPVATPPGRTAGPRSPVSTAPPRVPPPPASSSTSAGPPGVRCSGGTWTFREAPPQPPRRVRLAAVNHRPPDTGRLDANTEAFGALVEQAAERDADIVVLPEGITIVGSERSYVEAAEPVPGPTTRYLGGWRSGSVSGSWPGCTSARGAGSTTPPSSSIARAVSPGDTGR